MQIKSFRTIDEVKKYLADQTLQFRQEEALIEKSIGQLAKVKVKAAPSRILDISGDGPAERKKKTLNLDFPVVKVPNMGELQSNYKRAERLSEQYKMLVATENDVRLNFKGVTGKNLDAIMGGFTKLKADLENALRKLFKSLHEVAQKHAPQEYLAFVEGIAKEMKSNRHIECDSIDTFTYVALTKDEELVFAGYIVLKNAVSDDFKVAPHIYVTLKWTVGGNIEVFVEHEFILPGLLEQGSIVASPKAATQAITNQLSAEGFSAQIGNLPVSMQIKNPVGGLRREAFTAAEHIHSVTADKDELIFNLKDVSQKQKEEIKTQLFLEVKSMVRKKRSTKVRMRESGNTLVFTFSDIDQSEGIHSVDLDWLSDKYKLNDSQLRKIVNTING